MSPPAIATAELKEEEPASEEVVVSSTATPQSSSSKKGWFWFGGERPEDFDPGFPTDPEYYEQRGEPYPDQFEDFLDAFGRKKGPAMFRAYHKWRADMDIENIILKPYPRYWVMKENSPHFVYGRAKSGAWVSFELTGRINPSNLQKQGYTAHDVHFHLAWNYQWAYEFVDNRVPQKIVTVMDMKGFSIFKAANSFFLTLTRVYGDVLYNYYPGTLERVIVLNPPPGAVTIYKIMTAVLPKILTEKTIITNDYADMQKYIDPDQLPVEYGGTNPLPLNQSPFEVQLKEYLDKINGVPPTDTADATPAATTTNGH